MASANKNKIHIIGAAGQIGRLLCQVLAGRLPYAGPKAESHGGQNLAMPSNYEVVPVVRSSDQRPFFEDLGLEIRIADLEEDAVACVGDGDRVVFTAGSGGHTGYDKTISVDLYGAWQAIEAAEAARVEHFVMVSAIVATDPRAISGKLKSYCIAKYVADQRLKQSSIPFTIVRPGRLHNGAERPLREHLTQPPPPGDAPWPTSRAGVARFVAHCLARPEQVTGQVIDIYDS